jgi:hypothetical protein
MLMNAADFEQIAIGIFFILFGLGLGYALLRLAGTFSQATVMIHDVNEEAVPILNRLQTTVDEVNSELDKVNQITDTAVAATDKAGNTASAVQSAIRMPVRKIGGVAAGVAEAISSFFGSSRREV